MLLYYLISPLKFYLTLTVILSWKGEKCASPESGKEGWEGQEQLAKSGASGSFAPGTDYA